MSFHLYSLFVKNKVDLFNLKNKTSIPFLLFLKERQKSVVIKSSNALFVLMGLKWSLNKAFGVIKIDKIIEK